MTETPRTGDRVRWTRQIAIEGDVEEVSGGGFRIRDREGRVHLCQLEGTSVEVTERRPTTAEDGAEYVFRSNLRGNGAAFLSLHRLGDDVHLRLRHVSSEPLAFEVAVLSPSERRALIAALTEFDAARPSARVPNEPHSPSEQLRQAIGEYLTAGDVGAAIDLMVLRTNMDRKTAARYIQDMPGYRGLIEGEYYAEKARQREARLFRSDGPEPPLDIAALEWIDRSDPAQYPYLIRFGTGWLWSKAANRPQPERSAVPNVWSSAVRASEGTYREVFPS